MKKFLLLLVAFMNAPVMAQYGWHEVDTVTSGNYDDHNPRLDDGGLGTWHYGNRFEWLVFERWNGPQSAICALQVKPFAGDTLLWDSSVTTISPSTPGVPQTNPDICTQFESFYQDSVWTSHVPLTVAAWQRLDTASDSVNPTWDIYYCFSFGNDFKWSEPQLLSRKGDDVRVRSLSDTSLIIIWRCDRVLMYSVFADSQASSPDTLLVTNYDSTDFDFESSTMYYAYGPTVAWIGKDSCGKKTCSVAQITDLTPTVLSPLNSISLDGDVTHPRFINYTFERSIMVNVTNNEGTKPCIAISDYGGNDQWQIDYLTSDSSSVNLNSVGTTYPPIIIDKRQPLTKSGSLTLVPWLQLYAWERRTVSDTSLIFATTSSEDTVSSAGCNRNLSLGTYDFWVNGLDIYPCVWESDRTGRFHIYGRSGVIYYDQVNSLPDQAMTFQLHQNYPNPFNPSTVIGYRLTAVGRVSLIVYDILGRKVRTLVDERQSPGEHTAIFDASGLASGVYLYSLSSGQYRETKKLILLK